MPEGPHNSLRKLYTDALSRIEKREKVALSKALVSMGHYSVPAPYRRQEIRAFYNTLKEGLNHDYCEVMSCFDRASAQSHAPRCVPGVAGADGPRAAHLQRDRGHAHGDRPAEELL